jgi:hypothetical protein
MKRVKRARTASRGGDGDGGGRRDVEAVAVAIWGRGGSEAGRREKGSARAWSAPRIPNLILTGRSAHSDSAERRIAQRKLGKLLNIRPVGPTLY